MTGPKVCSVVFGDKALLWEYWMLKSLKRIHPNVIYHRFVPNMDIVHGLFAERTHDSTCEYCKSRAWAHFAMDSNGEPAPMWLLDADLLIMRPLAWRPASLETIIAMAPGGDVKYLEFAKLAGLQTGSGVHCNTGVIWAGGDLFPYWQKWYPRLRKEMLASPYHIGECTLNAVWHDLNNQGKAELLPESYNQIISEHGPYGANIFHLAGSPEHFKGRLMESYFRYFTGEQM